MRPISLDALSLTWTRSIVRGFLVGLIGLGFAIGGVSITAPALAQSSLDPVRPLLKSGSRGAEVEELQGMLKLLGFYPGPIDGIYSETVLIAVTQFQQAAGLQQDGVVGAGTWAKLLPSAVSSNASTSSHPTSSAHGSSSPSSTASPSTRPTSKPSTPAAPPSPAAASPFPVLRKGAKGEEVIRLQQRLQAIGLLKGSADGVFGDDTEAAVKAAQQQYKLEVDGIVGGATWQALMNQR